MLSASRTSSSTRLRGRETSSRVRADSGVANSVCCTAQSTPCFFFGGGGLRGYSRGGEQRLLHSTEHTVVFFWGGGLRGYSRGGEQRLLHSTYNVCVAWLVSWLIEQSGRSISFSYV